MLNDFEQDLGTDLRKVLDTRLKEMESAQAFLTFYTILHVVWLVI